MSGKILYPLDVLERSALLERAAELREAIEADARKEYIRRGGLNRYPVVELPVQVRAAPNPAFFAARKPGTRHTHKDPSRAKLFGAAYVNAGKVHV